MTVDSERGSEMDMVTSSSKSEMAPVPVNPVPRAEHAASQRLWQGIPGIERAPTGRLWATWYSGGKGEGPGNYVVLATSGDDGVSWTDPAAVVAPPLPYRAFDPVLWHDPTGRLWLFWAQCHEWFDGRAGVWAASTVEPDRPVPTWSEPRRLCNGVMMNKPTALSSGEWMLPAAVWAGVQPQAADLAAERYSGAWVTTDGCRTLTRRGAADVPDRTYDEHMIVERRDGSLWMLVRTIYGVGESVSRDGGMTWSPGRASAIPGPNSRFHIRRLRSGNLLLVNHYGFHGRSHLAARLSEDDGRTWRGCLMLDDRNQVSYPDSVQAEDGRVYVIYDRSRSGDREILMAVFREADVLAGRPVGSDTRLRQLVSRAG